MQPRQVDTSAYAFAQWMAAVIETKNAKRLLLKAFFAIRIVSAVASAVTVGQHAEKSRGRFISGM